MKSTKSWSDQTIPELEKQLKGLREDILRDGDYLLDDPGGYLQRELDREQREADGLEIYILKRKLTEKI